MRVAKCGLAHASRCPSELGRLLRCHHALMALKAMHGPLHKCHVVSIMENALRLAQAWIIPWQMHIHHHPLFGLRMCMIQICYCMCKGCLRAPGCQPRCIAGSARPLQRLPQHALPIAQTPKQKVVHVCRARAALKHPTGWKKFLPASCTSRMSGRQDGGREL